MDECIVKQVDAQVNGGGWISRWRILSGWLARYLK